MIYVQQNDWVEIRFGSILSDYDRRLLCLLYGPLVGYGAVSLYLLLWSEHDRKAYNELINHGHLFQYMQITPGEFQKARQQLEAVGLLETRYKEKAGINYYIYTLYAPKSPSDFFADPLFAGLYTKYVGPKEAEKMARFFTLKPRNDDYQDISANFNDVFLPNLDDPCYQQGQKLGNDKMRTRVVGDVKDAFDFGSFFATLASRYDLKGDKIFLAREKREISRVATLYGFDGPAMADIVYQTYQMDDTGRPSFRLEDLGITCQKALRSSTFKSNEGKKSKLSSKTRLAEKIRLIETVSAYEYLKIKQNYTQPVRSDVNLLDRLSSQLGLSVPVINTLVDYVLDVQDNKLPAAFTEKIGASLARAKIDNALDAMNFLLKQRTGTSHGKASSSTSTANNDELPSSAHLSEEEMQAKTQETYRKLQAAIRQKEGVKS